MVRSTYTENGKLETLRDGEGNKTTYEYDGHDRLAKTRFPHRTATGASSALDYEALTYDDQGGRLESRRLRDGQVIGFAYDDLGRLTAKNLPGTEPDVTYAYDWLNRMISASQPDFTLTFARTMRWGG